MYTKLDDLGMRIRQRFELILEVEWQGYLTVVFESVKLLKDLYETDNAKTRSFMKVINETEFKILEKVSLIIQFRRCLYFDHPEFPLITWLPFGSFSFRTFNSGDVKFVSRVLPDKLGLKVTNLDLLGVIEGEELFGKLVDDDVVCVCLLLALEDSTVNLDLTPTIAEHQFDWYKFFREFYIAYIPMTPPTRYPDLFDDYLKKLAASRKRGKIDTRDLPIICRCDTCSFEEIRLKDGVIIELNFLVFKLEAIIKVLGRERNGVLLDKSYTGEIFSNISEDYLDELNEEFHQLLQTYFIDNRLAMADLDYDDDIVKDYRIQEELRLELEEEEMCHLEEYKMMEALFLSSLKDDVRKCEEKRC
nr:phospholipase-like protein [Tanacetum cinerariifolium]